LHHEPNQSVCAACNAAFAAPDGIVRFVAPDPKYHSDAPGRWDHVGPEWLLPCVDAGITWFFSKHLPENCREATALDFGCGTGLDFLAARCREVHGVDLAPTALGKAREIYHTVSCASVLALPYPDEFFDLIVSVDVIEHIPLERKNEALTEMLRVLKPGGRMLHVLDLRSQKPLHRWAERDPELFRKVFIERMGHYGLETASEAIKRFEAFGMKRIAIEATNRTVLQHAGNYGWQFDNEYRHRSGWVRLLTSISYLIRRHRLLDRLYAGFLQLIWSRGPERLFPIDWSFNLAVAYEKRH
jgi:SAM-dependent methyltransferase